MKATHLSIAGKRTSSRTSYCQIWWIYGAAQIKKIRPGDWRVCLTKKNKPHTHTHTLFLWVCWCNVCWSKSQPFLVLSQCGRRIHSDRAKSIESKIQGITLLESVYLIYFGTLLNQLCFVFSSLLAALLSAWPFCTWGPNKVVFDVSISDWTKCCLITNTRIVVTLPRTSLLDD